MTERERLIELIKSVATVTAVNNGEFIETTLNTEEIADFLLENGVAIEPPLSVGATVYVITTCRDFPQELDGSWETATGYYCPCALRDDCPHDTDDCEKVADTEAVFTDQITVISTHKEGTIFDTSYTGAFNISDIGKTVFLTREEAKKALDERSNEE